MQDWNEFYIQMAEFVSRKSKDRSTKVGAVFVNDDNSPLCIVFNGFPRKVDDNYEPWHQRPAKYLVTAHAEENAICNAAAEGIRLRGSTLFLKYSPQSICARCARDVIQVGCKRIVGSQVPFPGKGQQWEEELRVAQMMLKQAGLELIISDCPTPWAGV